MLIIEKFIKPLLGSGITIRYPILRKIYERYYYLKGGQKINTFTLINGLKLQVKASDSSVGAMLKLQNEFEPFQTKLFLDELTTQTTFLDIGANVGYYTVIAADRCQNVYAFEPDPENFKLLQSNLKINSSSNVLAEQTAISDFNGYLSFKLNKYQKGNSSIDFSNHSKFKVPSITLDNWAKEKSFSNIVLKIDVEGAESRVLRGAKGFLGESKRKVSLYVEYNPSIENQNENVISQLKDLGFQIQIINERDRQLLSFTPENIQKTLAEAQYLTLYCRK